MDQTHSYGSLVKYLWEYRVLYVWFLSNYRNYRIVEFIELSNVGKIWLHWSRTGQCYQKSTTLSNVSIICIHWMLREWGLMEFHGMKKHQQIAKIRLFFGGDESCLKAWGNSLNDDSKRSAHFRETKTTTDQPAKYCSRNLSQKMYFFPSTYNFRSSLFCAMGPNLVRPLRIADPGGRSNHQEIAGNCWALFCTVSCPANSGEFWT